MLRTSSLACTALDGCDRRMSKAFSDRRLHYLPSSEPNQISARNHRQIAQDEDGQVKMRQTVVDTESNRHQGPQHVHSLRCWTGGTPTTAENVEGSDADVLAKLETSMVRMPNPVVLWHGSFGLSWVDIFVESTRACTERYLVLSESMSRRGTGELFKRSHSDRKKMFFQFW